MNHPFPAQAKTPPTTRASQPQYLGFRLWDLHTLDAAAAARGARSLEALGGVDFLARLLASNRTDQKPIVAVVRGRQEFGPRALGHRSLLTVPDSPSVKARMNRLKFREWYRPVAPMIADDDLELAFGRKAASARAAPAAAAAEREIPPPT